MSYRTLILRAHGLRSYLPHDCNANPFRDRYRERSSAGPVVSCGGVFGARMGVTLAGHVAPGFEAVRDVFAENLETGRDLGAAFAVTYEGRLVVDLYGGIADRATGDAWTDET